MKKTVKRIISLVLVLLMLPGIELMGLADLSSLFEVSAEASDYYTSGYCGEVTETNDGTNLSWTLDEDGTLTVTGTGRMAPEAFNIDLRIKSVVIGEGVENIGEKAFYQCTNITSVTFPTTLTVIEKQGFYECKKLVDVEFSNGLIAINNEAFKDCDNLKSIVLPASLETLGYAAFIYCDKLESVVFPDSLKKIYEYAFQSCNIQTIDLPDSLEIIGDYAFRHCELNGDIVIPENVNEIRSYAFANNPIRSISIGANVSHIGNNVFYGCNKLSAINVSADNEIYSSYSGILYNKAATEIITVPVMVAGEIIIPATVEEFKSKIFNSCIYITDFAVEEGNKYYTSVDGILYSADKKTLIRCPEGRVEPVVIADGTELLGEYSFTHCVNLESVTFSDTIITIGKYAFYYCSNLKEITLSDSVTTIDEYAFWDCKNLSDITFSKSLQSIGSDAFWCCENLKSINLPDGLKTIGGNAFWMCDLTGNVVIPDSVEIMGSGVFWDNDNLQSVYIGSGTKNLSNTFIYCSLYAVNVSPDNQNFSSVDGILYNKNKTELIFIPQMIDGSITIPAVTTKINIESIKNCSYITDINIDESNNIFTSIDGIVYTADKKDLIVCPNGKIGSVTVNYGTETIKNAAFKYCNKAVTEISLPDTLKTIESEAFSYCGFNKIDLPDSVETISKMAFYSSSKLNYINIPSKIEVVKDSIIGNTGLVELTYPETVQSFDHLTCSNLKILTIENKYCEYTNIKAPTVAKDCTIRAYCGSPGHTLATKRLLNFESLGHTYLDWYTVTPATYEADGIERRDCAYCDGYEERTIPMLQKDVFTATFVADGNVIATIDFPKGATEIEEPAVPSKDRYLGEWEEYTLSDSNITVNAVYTLIKSSNASEIEADSTVIHYTVKDDVLFRLSASADANVVKSTISNAVPLDIVLVVDQSGSMDETLGGNTKKVDALKDTALEFVNSVYENAKMTECDHRISLVGFGLSGNYNGYEKNENTELLTSANGIVNYSNITPADYASSLVSANVNGSVNAELINAVNSIGARGATAADLGFEMAKGIFANTDSTGRQRVVVFMTDGEPTYLSGFQTSVANSAIANAYTLKNAYSASIYSVGVFSSSLSNNSNITKFMNAVSSGYPNAMSMSSMGTGNDGEFFTTVSNTDALSSVFKSISTESLSHTAPFDNITFVKTLSEYVTLTSQQEQTLRIDLIRQYGVTNDDIVITRNSDGTTTIEINGLTPEKTVDDEGNVKYVVAVEFFASLNENAATADDYFVDTEDSGVMLSPDSKGYEVTFDTSAITLEEEKTRVIFTINGEVYEISENIDSNGYAVAPEIEISDDWTFVNWKTSAEKASNGLVLDATLTKAERTVTWHTDSEDIVQTYAEGDFITAPVVEYNKEGYAFLSWDRSVPTTMPDDNLEFTAVYGEHTHNYTSTVSVNVTCESDGTRTYTCNCGDTYTETIAALGHNYEAITPSIEKDDSKCTFVCTNCGDKYDYALDYEVVSASGKRTQVLYEFQLTDENLDYGFQPDGEIQIRIPLSDIHGNTKNVKVIRTNDDGSKTQVPAVIENGFLIITCDHFTPYEVNFEIDCAEHTDADSDGLCDTCEASVNTSNNTETECEHICHCDNEFIKFIWKLITFIYKAFRLTDKQICECGASHW
ncbi:MAG: leucine-rich repeat protein [Clostridia bacterium]|nr:leucine-rich repeat protein [Clostridia bacterium]